MPRTLDRGITVRAMGGLGNQLFQYAAGRSMAVRLGVQLFIDSRLYKKNTNRPFLLNQFRHNAVFIERNYLPYTVHKYFWKKFELPRLEAFGRYVAEADYDKLEQIKTARLGGYFFGYWQDPSLFIDIEDTLRQELQYVADPSFENAKMLDHIKSCCAVSVHIRRGDYLTFARHREMFATCPPAYYSKAFDLLISRLKQHPVFFVFSDDLDWAKENLKFSGKAVFVNINDDANSFEDLRLMAACQHHVIANSTFSWWGAWLNNSPDKMVVAPNTWSPPKGSPRNNLLLEGFHLIENYQ